MELENVLKWVSFRRIANSGFWRVLKIQGCKTALLSGLDVTLQIIPSLEHASPFSPALDKLRKCLAFSLNAPPLPLTYLIDLKPIFNILGLQFLSLWDAGIILKSLKAHPILNSSDSGTFFIPWKIFSCIQLYGSFTELARVTCL